MNFIQYKLGATLCVSCSVRLAQLAHCSRLFGCVVMPVSLQQLRILLRDEQQGPGQ